VAHQFLGGKWNIDWYEVPMLSGHRPINATSDWARGKSKAIYIDEVSWPDNKPCARKAASSEKAKVVKGKAKMLSSQ
jgi:hypothetical protein